MKKIQRMSSWLSALFFPPKCVGCGQLMPPSEGMKEIFCPLCRTAWTAGRLSEAEGIREGDHYLLGTLSVAAYRPGMVNGVPEKLIYHIKHRDEGRVFAYAASSLACPLQTFVSAKGISEENLVISYPPRRKAAIRKDGFDQAERLAKALSKQTGWPSVRLLDRTGKGQRAQKSLGAADRAANAADAYELSELGEHAAGKIVILVDDVYTTGATLRTCAELLRRAGAEGVILATVARR